MEDLISIKDSIPSTAVEARHVLRNWLLHLIETGEIAHGRHAVPRIVRLQTPVEQMDLLSWLNAQQHKEKLYWSSREEDMEVAGVGAADIILSESGEYDPTALFERVDTWLAVADRNVRYYGGARFQCRDEADTAWQYFGAYRFVLPEFELVRTGAVITLAWNIVLRADEPFLIDKVVEELETIVFPPFSVDQDLYSPIARMDTPDESGWHQNVETVLALLQAGALDKIVLARKAVFLFDTTLNPITLLQRLKSATPNCFHFCFQPQASLAFLGATPERLYKRTGRDLKSEAVAGTRPNGPSAGVSDQLGAELLASDKDQREHAFVREGIRERLAPLCESLTIAADPSLMKLARNQHLLSVIEGRLADGVTDANLLGQLHPTSSVGGQPTQRALEEISRLEPFDRGWYAGPIGWVASDAAEFAVAIRSGLIQGSELALYSGAGIVIGSTPVSEWNEIENKISDFIQVLAGEKNQEPRTKNQPMTNAKR